MRWQSAMDKKWPALHNGILYGFVQAYKPTGKRGVTTKATVCKLPADWLGDEIKYEIKVCRFDRDYDQWEVI